MAPTPNTRDHRARSPCRRRSGRAGPAGPRRRSSCPPPARSRRCRRPARAGRGRGATKRRPSRAPSTSEASTFSSRSGALDEPHAGEQQRRAREQRGGRAEQRRRAAEDERARGERRADHQAGVVQRAPRRGRGHPALGVHDRRAAARMRPGGRPWWRSRVTSASDEQRRRARQHDHRGERGGAHDVGGDHAPQPVLPVQPGADQRAGEHARAASPRAGSAAPPRPSRSARRPRA